MRVPPQERGRLEVRVHDGRGPGGHKVLARDRQVGVVRKGLVHGILAQGGCKEPEVGVDLLLHLVDHTELCLVSIEFVMTTGSY